MAFFPRHLAASAVLAALTLPVFAQPAAPANPAASAAPSETRPAASMKDRHQAHRAQHAAELKKKLQLTAEQEPAWNTFLQTMHGPDSERHARMDPKDLEKLSTPERIDRMRALRAQRTAEADRRGEAIKTFYATLSPAQQKTFDAETHRHHRMEGRERMEGRHGGEGHHGMHPGMGGMQHGDKPAGPR
ncbi:MAG: Spy/CpxP family protein refolding chaperone [Burkholderiaceae bacterium]|nr:Spy/CpxP family protein refolding chaperone [Burkholderiaceae bacterium]